MMKKIKLYKHQEVALAHMRVNNGYALHMSQGTGKTMPTLVRVLELAKDKSINNCLVVAPKSAMGAWDRDIELFDPSDQKILSQVITIINYDKVWRSGTKSEFNKVWDCIVLDEAHFIKNRTSKRSKFLLELSCKAKYKYSLTGTPISNGQLENIYSQLTFLDAYKEQGYIKSNIFKSHLNEVEPDAVHSGSYSEFQKRYCILNRYFRPGSYIHVNELQDLISQYSYRVTKEECLDLPDKLPDEIIRIDCGCKKEYKKLSTTSALVEFDVLAENPLSRMIKLRQMASGFLKLDDGSIIDFKCAKLWILQELIESFEDEKKLVIFANFKYSISKIAELLDKMKLTYLVLDGDQKDKKIWRKFQSDPGIKIIICQYQTASSGIDLFASDTIIYYEPTIRTIDLEQSRDRIHRSGQKWPCSYYHILTKGTIEVDIYRALSHYEDFTEELFTKTMTQYNKRR